MKKIDNRAFALVETLIVSTVVCGILIYFFVQFATIKRNYNTSFKYNRVDDLYALEDVIDYLYTLDRGDIKNYIVKTINDKQYISVLKNDEYYDNIEEDFHPFYNDYGQELLSNLEIEQLYITKEDTSSLEMINFSPKMRKFIQKMKFNNSYKYKLIAHFTNDSYASVSFNFGGDLDE